MYYIVGILFSTIIYYINNKLISIITLPFFICIALWVNKDYIVLIKKLIKGKIKLNE